MAVPDDSYEVYSDKYAVWLADGGDPEAFVPRFPSAPVVVDTTNPAQTVVSIETGQA